MSLCPYPSSVLLQFGTCVSPFTSLPVEFPPPNPQLPPPPPTFTTVCTLDLDSDGIADLQVLQSTCSERGGGLPCMEWVTAALVPGHP